MATVTPTTTTPTTTGTGSTTSTKASTSSDALNKLSSDFNNFLTLLTTQLKNQDPLSPMDSTQFTSQLVAFTGVEQQINTNSKLDQLISLDKTSQLTAAAGYIGDTIEATSDQVYWDGKTSAGIGYNLPADASTAAMAIYDSTGNTVRTGTVPITKGRNLVEWDGTNNAGAKVPAGVYSFTVQALGQDQQPMTGITTSTAGIVTNVSSDSTTGVQLSIGSLALPLSAVMSIKKPS